ncbi:class I SAM-dependent methyltransferase [Nocardia sp. NPDC051052]|uniref:class I SAM-dependent methyltransferase n=1 Tax=Nocardia sp. NPDC051052 TaxID=3364322 RepID=UPI00379DA568
MSTDDPKDLVRHGYNALSEHYDKAFGGQTKYQAWLAELDEHIPSAARVLDLGCGSGIPVARMLAATGRRVVGVDISDIQIARARQLVPDAEFVRADATAIDFGPDSFDAIVCLYALIHIPLDQQFPLLAKIAGWLRPQGVFVATTGHHAWTGIDDNWLGTGHTMWWSHTDALTYRAWLTQAGLAIRREEFIPEGSSGHTLFWAAKP